MAEPMIDERSEAEGGGRERPLVPVEPVARTASEFVQLESAQRQNERSKHRVAARFTQFYGSVPFLAIHAALIPGWLLLNSRISPLPPWDPFPFALLGLIVGIEVLVLSTFVLISQNRESEAEQQRARVDMQMGMVAEQEITKLVEMVNDIRRHLGMASADDPEAEAMQRPTFVSHLTEAIENAERDIATGNNPAQDAHHSRADDQAEGEGAA